MTAARDPWTGVVAVSVGSATQKVVVSDDPAVQFVLLSEGQSSWSWQGWGSGTAPAPVPCLVQTMRW
jgi:hypothetical protein